MGGRPRAGRNLSLCPFNCRRRGREDFIINGKYSTGGKKQGKKSGSGCSHKERAPRAARGNKLQLFSRGGKSAAGQIQLGGGSSGEKKSGLEKQPSWVETQNSSRGGPI